MSSQSIQIKNIPLALIDMIMFKGWEECGKYVKTGSAKNTNPAARNIDTWILLKTLTTSGNIHNYNKQLGELAALCKIEKRALQYRISWLQKNNLMQKKGKNLYLHSYKALEQQFGVDTKERLKIAITYDPADDKRLAEILYLIGLKRKEERCNYMYNKKMDQTPDVKHAIENRAITYGAQPDKLRGSEYFRQSHDALMVRSYKTAGLEDTFHLTHNFCTANPDLNLTQATLGKENGFTVKETQDERTKKDTSSCPGVGHLHRRLATKGLITLSPRYVVSEYRARKDEKVFHHRYARATKQTIWYRPNHIKINYETFFSVEKVA